MNVREQGDRATVSLDDRSIPTRITSRFVFFQSFGIFETPRIMRRTRDEVAPNVAKLLANVSSKIVTSELAHSRTLFESSKNVGVNVFRADGEKAGVMSLFWRRWTSPWRQRQIVKLRLATGRKIRTSATKIPIPSNA